MIEDGYKISSNFRPSKGAVNCKVKRFFTEFEEFYIKVLANDNPDLPHTICDPYGFALLCEDYKDKINNEIRSIRLRTPGNKMSPFGIIGYFR